MGEDIAGGSASAMDGVDSECDHHGVNCSEAGGPGFPGFPLSPAMAHGGVGPVHAVHAVAARVHLPPGLAHACVGKG
eukprot:3840168-Alexandrium_andersonii.AAC.1